MPAATDDRIHPLDELPLTRRHLLVLLVAGLGLAFDLMEMAMGGALSAIFSSGAQPLARQEFAWLLGSIYLGAAIGAPLFGVLADRIGRRAVLAAVLIFLSLVSVGAAFSERAGTLSWWRAASGLALGAYPPLMVAYLTDVLPARHRNAWTMATLAVASLGAPAGLLLLRALTPIEPLGLEAWRWCYLLAGGGALLTGVAWLILPESPRWLGAIGQHAQAARALRWLGGDVHAPSARSDGGASGRLTSAGSQPRATHEAGNRGIRLALLFFLSAWATVAFPVMSGALILAKGLSLNDALGQVAAAAFGPVIGQLLCGWFAGNTDRRHLIAGCAIGMGFSAWAFLVADTTVTLLLANTSFMVFGAVLVPNLHLYGAEILPTEKRARVLGTAWSANRISAAIAPFLLVPVLQHVGVIAVTQVVAVSLLIMLVLLVHAPAAPAKGHVS